MPIDDALAEVAGFVIRQTAGVVVELVVDQIFSRYTARFFHSVGRRVIAVASFGLVRIPSSLRVVPAGVKAKPMGADWFALIVGIICWIGLAIGVCGLIWAQH